MSNASMEGKIIVLIRAMMLLIYGVPGISHGRTGLPTVTVVITTLSISMMAPFFAFLPRDRRHINDIF